MYVSWLFLQTQILNFFSKSLLWVCVCGQHVCAMVHLRRSEANTVELVLSFSLSMGSRAPSHRAYTQILNLCLWNTSQPSLQWRVCVGQGNCRLRRKTSINTYCISSLPELWSHAITPQIPTDPVPHDRPQAMSLWTETMLQQNTCRLVWCS